MKKLITLALLTISFVNSFSQTGLTGTFKNSQGEAIAFGYVMIENSASNATTTDMDGNYTLLLSRGGRYNVVFMDMASSDTLKNIVVLEGKLTTLNHQQKESAIVMDDVEIKVERKVEADLGATLEEEKESVEVADVISTDEAEKTGAGDAAAVAKKVVGVSTVGSGYVFVRGMGDRYNNASLNGLPVPSPDPDKKVIPLNIFPTGVTNSISVAKTFSTNAYGDFSGGLIDIRTKEYPENHFFKFSLSQGYNTQSSFKDFNSYTRESNDYFGFGKSGRALPSNVKAVDGLNTTDGGFPTNPFSTKWNPLNGTAPTNGGIGFAYGNKIEVQKDKLGGPVHTFGYLINLDFDNSYGFNEGAYRIVNKQYITKVDFNVKNYNYSANSNALINLHYDLDKKYNFDYTYLFVNMASDQTKIVRGTHFDFDQHDFIYTRRYTYRQNQLKVHQLRGKFLFGDKDRLEFSWAGSMAGVENVEPDRRQLVYFGDIVNGKDMFQFNTQDRRESHRFYSQLNESEYAGRGELKYNIRYSEKQLEEDKVDTLPTWYVAVGGQAKVKARDFEYWLYSYYLNDIDAKHGNTLDPNDPDKYLSDANYASGLFSIKDDAGVEAPHSAGQQVIAAYLNTVYDIIPFKLQFIGGVRFENGYQHIKYKPQSSSPYKDPELNVLDTISILPSLSLKYIANEKNIFRLAASQTVSRPGFRELAPFEYTEVFAGIVNVGNPNLKNGTNYNFDVRYEHYPSDEESFAISGFYKQLIDPIEQTFIANPSGQKQTFQNTAGATVAGAEFEVNKSLAFLDSGIDSITMMPTGVGRYFTVGANVAYIFSQVSFDTTQTGASLIATNLERPLQGASPFLANAHVNFSKGFFADSVGNYKYKTSFTLSYNVFAKRLYSAGIQGIGDAYQMPVNTLNLVVGLEYKKWDFKLKFLNLLNPEYRIVQDAPAGQEGKAPVELSTYKKGVAISAGISYSFDLK